MPRGMHATIFLTHRDWAAERRYSYSVSPDLEELFPEGVVLDTVAVGMLIQGFTEIQARVSFGFGVDESGVMICSLTGDNSWVGVTNYIEPVIKYVLQDWAARFELEVEVA